MKISDYALAIIKKEMAKVGPRERMEWLASFAFWNLSLMKKYESATTEELEKLKQLCREMAGLE